MKRSERITHIMSAEPVTAHEAMKLSDVRKLLADKKIHHVPVVSGRRFIGLLSATDLMRVSYGDVYSQDVRTVDALLDTMSIREVMSEDVVTAPPTATIHEVAELLANGSFHSVPIVDEAGDLVGIVTSTDVIRFLLAQY
ncbi:MAG: CBS domain-containing protein [Nannocystaceae bacterium]